MAYATSEIVFFAVCEVIPQPPDLTPCMPLRSLEGSSFLVGRYFRLFPIFSTPSQVIFAKAEHPSMRFITLLIPLLLVVATDGERCDTAS